ncbi:MAG: hypothetical protein K5898_04055 [Ruminococcus sp.]|uniref:hypothetical protein n=1 Tax=Ruminococcus sp. TaxID=41978 RepID=UPI0025F45785|nr:hypothetical protein [Ruminococcus sp.]MCR4794337.1 hypothetical protein [Ruminococcus sp.]
MKKIEILEKLPKFPIPEFRHSDAQVLLRLVTILAATHLAGKVNRVLKRIEKMDHPHEFLDLLK